MPEPGTVGAQDPLSGIELAVAPRKALERIFERLDREAQLVVVQKAIFTRLNAEASRYPRSRAAHPFQIIVGNALNMVAMGVARLWDDTVGVQSIPNALSALRTGYPGRSLSAEWLSGERRLAENSHFIASGDPDEQEHWRLERMVRALDNGLAGPVTALQHRYDLLQLIRRLRKREVLVHLHELRNTIHAHALDISEKGKRRQQAGAEVRYPLVGELLDLADETVAVVAQLNLLVRQLDTSYGDLLTAFEDHVEDLVRRGLMGKR